MFDGVSIIYKSLFVYNVLINMHGQFLSFLSTLFRSFWLAGGAKSCHFYSWILYLSQSVKMQTFSAVRKATRLHFLNKLRKIFR